MLDSENIQICFSVDTELLKSRKSKELVRDLFTLRLV